MLIVDRMRYRQTDQQTNQPTDRASYRGALSHLKSVFRKKIVSVFLPDIFECANARDLGLMTLFYKNVIFFPKSSKETKVATIKIATMFLILEHFEALIFL